MRSITVDMEKVIIGGCSTLHLEKVDFFRYWVTDRPKSKFTITEVEAKVEPKDFWRQWFTVTLVNWGMFHLTYGKSDKFVSLFLSIVFVKASTFSLSLFLKKKFHFSLPMDDWEVWCWNEVITPTFHFRVLNRAHNRLWDQKISISESVVIFSSFEKSPSSMPWWVLHIMDCNLDQSIDIALGYRYRKDRTTFVQHFVTNFKQLC